MYRLAMNSVVALLTFALGILVFNIYGYLYIVLPIMFVLWLLARKIASMNLTLHHLQVVLITTVLSAVVIYIFLTYFMPCPSGLCHCEPYRSGMELNGTLQ